MSLVDWRFALAGLLVGVFAGLSGVGGSALLAPVLIVLLGVKARVAIGTDLAYGVPMKALAAYAHVRQKTVDGGLVRALAIGGIPGALAGLAAFVVLRAHIPEAALESSLRHVIGIVILISAAASLLAHLTYEKRREETASGAAFPAARVIAIGAGVGFLVALTSIGSGSITLPLLMLVFPAVALRSLIGAEIVFAALMVPVAAAGHIALANVDWPIAISLTIGALPGAYIGARLCAVIGENALRPAVIVLLGFAGFKLL